MNSSPTVVVRKGSFLSAFAIGFFTFLTGVVVCATAVTFYGMRIVDLRSGDAVATVQAVLAALPEWRAALPPAVLDALQDEREPAYRDELEVTARVVPGRGRNGEGVALVEVTNNGCRTVSLLSVRVTLEDQSGVPLHSYSTYLATPLAIGDDEWRGPLLPGATRRITGENWRARGAAGASVEVNELRLWADQTDVPAAAPRTALAP